MLGIGVMKRAGVQHYAGVLDARRHHGGDGGAFYAFDSAKVGSIKRAIKDGQFTINSSVIADELLAGEQEFLKEPH